MTIEQAAEIRSDWDKIPVYKYTGEYAREHNELEQYRESFRANNVCKQVIEDALAKAFDGWYLAKDCELPVIEMFGMERVVYVLAITLQEKCYDMRFSRENIFWAKGIEIAADPGSIPEMRNRNIYHAVNFHSEVLNGFVTRIRKMNQ